MNFGGLLWAFRMKYLDKSLGQIKSKSAHECYQKNNQLI